ncbi:Maf family protein [Ferribacterium limneticum]|uniref:Maf family protein n=1 Tax=Ferribacterium limneticum TaxID=76259 RepID=UPI001CFBC412|nr:Maf family protein [Ferribacterium limneticum]UCV28708.1 septum formation inhibitor Maf [Ferribacterium limneticum]UCV32625.1 septum formation inhibitor Maf [Ferribacterium limneticum]
MRLYLASRSPRRRELLNQIGIDFDTVVFRDGTRADSETDETPQPGESPVAYVERVARAKAIHGLKIVEERKLPMRPVLSADTTLEFNGSIIGKPVDRADAAAILRRLSGHTHRVLTGVAINHMGHSEYVLSTSEVTFREIDDEEIRHYVMSGEPMDKAGAYGIQGRAGLFVKHLSGSFTGVMGLPVCETGDLLKKLGFRPL